MAESLDATQLLDRWRAGDKDAATELFHLFSRKLAALAERQISQRLGRRIDGDDVVQSAFRTFFRRGERGDFKIDNSAALWRLLVKITLAKAHSQARRHTSPKRDVGAETADASENWEVAAFAHDPSPSDALVLVDLMHAAVAGLPETYAEILSQRLAGYTRSEIAANLDISRQTVYRALGVMGQRLEASLAASPNKADESGQ